MFACWGPLKSMVWGFQGFLRLGVPFEVLLGFLFGVPFGSQAPFLVPGLG